MSRCALPHQTSLYKLAHLGLHIPHIMFFCLPPQSLLCRTVLGVLSHDKILCLGHRHTDSQQMQTVGSKMKSVEGHKRVPNVHDALLQVEDSAFEMNESILERLLTVDDVDAIHTNCAGLSV